MTTTCLEVSCVSLALLVLTAAPALPCPIDSLAGVLARAEDARSWSEFWEDMDPGEAQAELRRARWLYGRAERRLLQSDCLDADDGAGYRLATANGQRWVRRALASRSQPAGVAAVAAVNPR